MKINDILRTLLFTLTAITLTFASPLENIRFQREAFNMGAPSGIERF